jgi:hypothetical protein
MPYHLADASAFTHQFLEGPYARVPKELGCAFTASFLVSPLVSIIDKAIVQEIAGISHLMRTMGEASKEMVTKPKQFLNGLSFRLTFVVYFGTYAVANLSEAALDYYKVKAEETRKAYKVSAASGANIGLLAWRDSVFAREFSAPGAVKRATPKATFAGFAVRDCATMAATFYFAPKATEYLVLEHDVNRHMAEIGCSLSIPVFSQFLTAPVHIAALDIYNRPDVTTGDRVAQIKKEFGKVCFARGLRILPAFGIGSFSNNKFRELTIRQPNEELLLTRRITRRITQLNDKLRGRRAATTVDATKPMVDATTPAK